MSTGEQILNAFMQYVLPPLVMALAALTGLALKKLADLAHAKAQGSKVGAALVQGTDWVSADVSHVIAGLAPAVRDALANDGKISEADVPGSSWIYMGWKERYTYLDGRTLIVAPELAADAGENESAASSGDDGEEIIRPAGDEQSPTEVRTQAEGEAAGCAQNPPGYPVDPAADPAIKLGGGVTFDAAHQPVPGTGQESPGPIPERTPEHEASSGDDRVEGLHENQSPAIDDEVRNQPEQDAETQELTARFDAMLERALAQVSAQGSASDPVVAHHTSFENGELVTREISQCIMIRTNVPAREETNGAVPEMARLATEPMTITRMASNAVASPRKRFLPTRT